MIDIDIKTILFYLSLGNFFILIFLLFFNVDKKRGRFNLFTIAKFLQAIAWFLLAEREQIPDSISIYFSNSILFLGFGFEMLSLVTYKVRFSSKSENLFYTLLIILTSFFVVTGLIWPVSRVSTASIISGLIFAYGGFQLIKRSHNSTFELTLGRANIIFALILFYRAFSFFLTEFNLFSNNVAQHATFASVFLILLLNTMGYLLLLKKLDEDEILAKNEKLQKLNNEKNKFFSIIAHDLRGPIGNLSTLSELLNDQSTKDGNTDKERLISSINTSATESYKLLNNLLEWSQAEIDGLEVRTTKINLNELVESNIALLQEIANAKSINLLNEVENEINVNADPNMLDTIIRNLLSNGLKFTSDNGFVTIKSNETENGVVTISIQDNGVGMPDDVIHKLFKIDTHHSTKGTRNEAGTGLGLNLCKEFVERNEGKIWVESLENEGSTFYFTLKKA